MMLHAIHCKKLILDFLRRPAPIILGLLLVLFVPFVNKAIHIDDYFFLAWGDLFGWNPLEASPMDYYYQGVVGEDVLPYTATHPLFIPYLLKVLQFFWGRNEVLLHSFFILFPAMALWGLARFWEAVKGDARGVILPLVLFGALPAFVVNGQNLMSDVPTLAFLLAGAGVFFRNSAQGKGAIPWWGIFWLTCAVFSSYQALFFVPVLVLFVLLGKQSRRERWRLVIALSLPVLLMAVWTALVYWHYGVVPGQEGSAVNEEMSRGLQWEVTRGRLVFILAMTGASLIFVLPLKLLSARRGLLQGGSVALALLTVLFWWGLPRGASDGGNHFCLAFLCSLGLMGLGAAFVEIRRLLVVDKALALGVFLGGWIAIVLSYNALLLPFGSARYLLPLFPVLFVVLLKDVDLSVARNMWSAKILLACALVWGGANAWSDYYYADTYRKMAAEVSEFNQSLMDGQKIWYIGEWGMRHYFDQSGANYLTAKSLEPRSGDYIVIPEMPKFWLPAMALRPRLQFYASREFRSWLPLRLFNRRGGAGFYCHLWGPLPFVLSGEPDEVFLMLKVQ